MNGKKLHFNTLASYIDHLLTMICLANYSWDHYHEKP